MVDARVEKAVQQRRVYHTWIDGQMEHQNCTIKQLVRALAFEDYNWIECLTLMELALNNAVADLTSMSPAHVTYG